MSTGDELPATNLGPVGAAIRAHHAALAAGLSERVTALISAADGLTPGLEEARTELAGYGEAELLPHAAAEEASLYAEGAELPSTRLLVTAMTIEHAELRSLIDDVFTARTFGELTAAAGALRSLFHIHVAKENDLFAPALAEAGVDLDRVVGHLHEILGPGSPETLAPGDARDYPPSTQEGSKR